MISKFPDRCKGCGKATNEGEDIYWTKEEGGWHWACWDNRKPGPESFRLADELGYANHDELMAGDRPVLLLSLPIGNQPAESERRDDAPRGLFDSVPRMPETENSLK